MQRSHISTITNLATAISNPRSGDCIFLDLDDTLLLIGLEKYKIQPDLIEKEIVSVIKMLRERGIKVMALTARQLKYAKKTLTQLRELGIELDEVIHAPSLPTNNKSLSKVPQKWLALQNYVYSHQQEVQSGQLKRLFVFDNDINELNKIEEYCQNLGVSVHLKHFNLAEYLTPTEHSKGFPETLDNFTQYQYLDGGTGSTLKIINPLTKQTLVLKYGAHENAGKLETLGNAIYQIIGVKVPAMRIYHRIPKVLAKALKLNKQHGKFKVTEFIPEAKNIIHSTRRTLVINAAQQHFIAHVFMGNIDIAKEDNFIVHDSKNIYMIDAGANFIYRSKGKKRKENPSLASEIDSLRNARFNETGAVWFKYLSESELSEQLNRILAKIPDIENTVWRLSLDLQLPVELRNQFLENLSDRLDSLKTRLQHRPQHYAKVDKKANPENTAAGVLTYHVKNGQTFVLLSKRVRHAWWDNFGGKSELGDESLAVTAVREVAEESSNQINYTEWELLNSPCHDIVTEIDEKKFLYRMYICHYSEIDLTKLQDSEHTQHAWVSLNDLMEAVKKGELIKLENETTVVVKYGTRNLPIYPPLFKMLMQASVMAILEKIKYGEKIRPSATLSYADETSNITEDFTRPLISPTKKRNELAANLLTKSEMICELKKKNQLLPPEIETSINYCLSQTEFYMKMHLGEKYKEGDTNLYSNIHTFVSQYYRIDSDDMCNKLVDACVTLILNEKQFGNEYFYIYHGVNNVVAFMYDVYTELYSSLQASEYWHALRDDNAFLRQFENIIQLIAHYSNKGSKKIHNDDPNYNDCAISANVFLFGCHTILSSSSVHYMLKNEISRDLDLKSLITNIFKPFNVSDQEIVRLISIYKQYAMHQGGRLYQIGMTQADMQHMSYAAKSGGRIHYFNKNCDLTAIMQQLIADMSNVDEHREYISKLQARVMLPPSLRLKTEIITWKQLRDEELRAYQANIKQVANALVAKMLKHYVPDSKPGIRQGALLVALPHILKTNDLTYDELTPVSEIIKAVKMNDQITAQRLLKQFPNLISKTIHLPKAYIDFSVSNIPNTLTVASYILKQTEWSLTEIIDFSQNDWPDLFPEIKYTDLIKLLLRIPEDQSVKLVMKHHASLFNTKTYDYKILLFLPVKDRLIVAKHCSKEIFQFHKLTKIAKRLLPEQRLEYVLTNMTTFRDLIYVLPLLATDAERINLIKKNLKLIVTEKHGSEILINLAVESRCEIFNLIFEDIAKCNSTISVSIFSLLPESSRLTYVKEYAWMFSARLLDLLQALPEGEDRLEFATHSLVTFSNHPQVHPQHKILTLLIPDDRLPFLIKMGKIHSSSYSEIKNIIPRPKLYYFMLDRIDNEQALIFTLSLAPSCSKLELVNKHSSLITSEKAVSAIVTLLEKEYRFKFAMQFIAILNEPYYLTQIAKQLSPNEKQEFLISCIKDARTLSLATKGIPLDQRLSMARKHSSHITNCVELHAIIELLDQEQPDRLYFTTEVIDILPNPTEGFEKLISSFSKVDGKIIIQHIHNNIEKLFEPIIEYLGNQDGLSFGLEHIQNENQLLYMLDRIDINGRLAFATANKHKIISASVLCDIELKLQPHQRYVFKKSCVNNDKLLANILPDLPEAEFFEFVCQHKHLITSSSTLVNILIEIKDEKQASHFIKITDGQIQDNQYLKYILFSVPQDEKLSYIKRNLKDGDGVNQAIPLLPKDEVITFITEHKHLISNFMKSGNMSENSDETHKIFSNDNMILTDNPVLYTELLSPTNWKRFLTVYSENPKFVSNNNEMAVLINSMIEKKIIDIFDTNELYTFMLNWLEKKSSHKLSYSEFKLELDDIWNILVKTNQNINRSSLGFFVDKSVPSMIKDALLYMAMNNLQVDTQSHIHRLSF